MKLDISQITRSTKVALEKQATDSFGSVVEDFARGSLGLPARDRTGKIPLGPDQKPKPGTWNATSYAAVLAGATPLRPKLKFLFKVQFLFNEQVLSQFPGDLARKLQENAFTFMIKSVDRPKVDFEYEDDVNLYNYRTKVLKRIRHRELTITFMDDVGNSVFDFFRALMMIYSPITRDAVTRDNGATSYGFPIPDFDRFTGENHGMQFSNLEDFSRSDVSHRAVVNSSAGNAINLIRVKQIFVDPTTTPGNSENAVKAVFYDFVNPRLVSFDLDDLSHELSDPNLLTMQFDYDWLEMTKHDSLIATGDGGPEQEVVLPTKTVSDGSSSGAPRDILIGANPQVQTPSGTPQKAGRGEANPFVKILGGAANRALTKVTSDLVNKSVKQIAGNGRFANSALGRAFTGGIGSAVSGVSGSLGGLVGGAVTDGLGGLFSKTDQSTTRASSPVFNDKSTAGADSPKSTASSSNAYAAGNPARNDGGEI